MNRRQEYSSLPEIRKDVEREEQKEGGELVYIAKGQGFTAALSVSECVTRDLL